MPPPASNPDLYRLTLKLVCESHLRCTGNLPSKFGFSNYSHVRDGHMDRQIDRQTDKQTKEMLIFPFPVGGGHNYWLAIAYNPFSNPWVVSIVNYCTS